MDPNRDNNNQNPQGTPPVTPVSGGTPPQPEQNQPPTQDPPTQNPMGTPPQQPQTPPPSQETPPPPPPPGGAPMNADVSGDTPPAGGTPPPSQPEEPQNPSNKGPIMIIIVVLVVLFIVLLGYLVYAQYEQTQEEVTPTPTPAIQEQPTVPPATPTETVEENLDAIDQEITDLGSEAAQIDDTLNDQQENLN